MKVEIGDKVKIIKMKNKPHYSGKIGVVNFIDDFGQLFGTWGGLAICLDNDEIEIIGKEEK